MPLLIKILISSTIIHCYANNISSTSWGKRFIEDFMAKCYNKHAWVRKYLENQAQHTFSPNRTYAISIFDDSFIRARKGGLGDRLGGIITTFIWSLRTNRTFLIESNKNGLSTMMKPLELSDLGAQKVSSESWANVYRTFQAERSFHAKERTYLWCINPKPRSLCALESHKLDAYKVVRVRLNRCYLCRWASNPSLRLQSHLQDLLGINDETSLFEVGGCILRLLLWPRQELWRSLEYQLHGHVEKQIGFHFRCGDHNYKSNANNVVTPQLHPEIAGHMQCSQQDGQPWNGTHAVDELSPESPLDSALCGRNILHHLQSNYSNSSSLMTYIASDSTESAAQIATNIHWPNTVVSPPGCHIDYDPTPQCAVQTIAAWFALAVSDYQVVQSYSDAGTRYASSSFARYAMIYGLRPEAVFFPAACAGNGSDGHGGRGGIVKGYYSNEKQINRVSRMPQGNWVCTGGPIY